ncbi:MAG TPA: hypothetical protein VFB76_02350 [Candidatus Angelobacter sp.]|nr:hypothetical protein [Candidatus Angelobacter sp.]
MRQYLMLWGVAGFLLAAVEAPRFQNVAAYAQEEHDAPYFPAQAFGDPAMVQVFSKILAHSGEVSLYHLATNHAAHSYRLLWLTRLDDW